MLIIPAVAIIMGTIAQGMVNNKAIFRKGFFSE
jgi:hypothetical protein